MYRQQISLALVVLVLSCTPTLAADGWVAAGKARPAVQDGFRSTVSGKLQHNTADENGIAPYALVDRWGVVSGYVSPEGLELEPYLGRQVTLEGSVRDLPGGGMTVITARRIVSGKQASTVAAAAPATEAPAAKAVFMASRPSPVQPASHNEPLRLAAAEVPLLPIPQDPPVVTREPSVGPPQASDVPGGPAALYSGGAVGTACGPTADCGPDCGDCEPCPMSCCPPGPRWWVRTEYLLWWMRGMNIPPLATTGPSANQPGLLGEPGTEILIGNERINDGMQPGGRLKMGVWLDPCNTVGFDGEFFALNESETHFRMWSDGNPIISRPFFDARETPPLSNVEFVAYPRGNPGSIDGAINVDSLSRLLGAGAHLRLAMRQEEAVWSDACGSGLTFHDKYRSYFTVGYRFLRLDDRLRITEQLTSTSPQVIDEEDPTVQGVEAFLVRDQFDTTNQFHGVDLGFVMEMQRNRWSLEIAPRVAFGNTHQMAQVDGATRSTDVLGVQRWDTGGLLAQETNIGRYKRDQFSVIPEVGLTLGLQLNRHVRTTFGYTFLYWSNVARAGDQVDLTVNSTLLPGSTETPRGDLTRPAFSFHESGFWAQGFNFGLDLQW